MHRSIKKSTDFLDSTELIIPSDVHTTEQFAVVGNADRLEQGLGFFSTGRMFSAAGDAEGGSDAPKSGAQSLTAKHGWHTIFTLKGFEVPAIMRLVSLQGDVHGDGELIAQYTEAEKEDHELELSSQTKRKLNNFLAQKCHDEVELKQAGLDEVQAVIKDELLWEHVLLHGRGRLGEHVLHLCFLAEARPPFRKLLKFLLEKYAAVPVLQPSPLQGGLRRDGGGQRDSKVAAAAPKSEDSAVEFEWVPLVDVAYTTQPYYVSSTGMEPSLGCHVSPRRCHAG